MRSSVLIAPDRQTDRRQMLYDCYTLFPCFAWELYKNG